jgi:hypothetical protein
MRVVRITSRSSTVRVPIIRRKSATPAAHDRVRDHEAERLRRTGVDEFLASILAGDLVAALTQPAPGSA